jgi:hypothetical protein
MVTMADSDAVRQARRRHHRAGDHSMCRQGCQVRGASVRIAPVPEGSGQNLDPSAALRDLAAQLRAACEADPSNAVLAREYRATLMALLPSPGAGIDGEFKALMAELSKPVPRSETGDWLDGS